MKKPIPANHKEKINKRCVYLDILVGVSIFLVVLAFAYMILNPGKNQSDIRNSRRNADILAVMQGLAAYVNTTGNLPQAIPLNRECASIGNEICKTDALDCKGLVDLSGILKEGTILPVDASRKAGNGTGYYVSHDGGGRIIMCAPFAERNIDIIVKQFMY